jgi:hypothetical protein
MQQEIGIEDHPTPLPPIPPPPPTTSDPNPNEKRKSKRRTWFQMDHSVMPENADPDEWNWFTSLRTGIEESNKELKSKIEKSNKEIKTKIEKSNKAIVCAHKNPFTTLLSISYTLTHSLIHILMVRVLFTPDKCTHPPTPLPSLATLI